jgi:hypothetical protein
MNVKKWVLRLIGDMQITNRPNNDIQITEIKKTVGTCT